METLFTLARELAAPNVWSAGVELARNGHFAEAGVTGDERTFRVQAGPRDRPISVSLSEANELWQCSCGSEDDPCRHVVATIIAVRNGAFSKALVRAAPSLGTVQHRFTRRGDLLEFERVLAFGEELVVVSTTLASSIKAEERSGRGCIVSDEDLAVDYVLPTRKRGVLDPQTMGYLLAALRRVPVVLLDDTPVRISPVKHRAEVEVIDENDGYRLRRALSVDSGEIFRNGVGYSDGELFSIDDAALSASDFEMLGGDGTFFDARKEVDLATVIIPSLQKKVSLAIRSARLPRARCVSPRIIIEASEAAENGDLLVVPRLVYGEPPIAEVQQDYLRLFNRREVPIRERVEEARLTREVNIRLGLTCNTATIFRGAEAALFTTRLKGWSVIGQGGSAPRAAQELKPVISSEGSTVSLSFATLEGGSVGLGDALAAYSTGAAFVRVPSTGGESRQVSSSWGALPVEWLRQHEDALRRLLEAKSQAEAGAGTPAQLLPEVQEICESLSFEPPDYFAALRRGLEQVEEIPNPELPLDLTVSLRSYQRVGVAWLNFLRTHGLSGLLADDMGLGKTLQALCIIQGRALVVAPASVIHAWRLQAEKFRPRLKVSVYHGPARSLDPAADLTITTYGLVRSDVGELEGVSWDTLVLDEAQVFRNPDSLLAGAIRRLKAAFRVNLSGTPIENSLDDLWSQFAVLLPGLLGSRQEFHEIAQRIEAGDSSEALRLQNRVRPFILRRLKRDVAPELPEKTEVVLYADLSHDERTAYQAILGSTRREILDSMDAGLQEDIPVFSLLETLMRLRQACCHRALLPAMDAVQSSSKLELLSECLRNSISQGHRALVFSQWTSFLDLIEPHLRAMNCSFSRIDGSTKDRHVVTEEFQKPDGPQVMLLSLKAGGLGLTLTAADHVYIVDPWWNPAAEEQAADRVYRIGQENPVMVHRLVARDTVEERVLALQEQKRALAAAVVGDKGESVRLSFTRAEMLTLLE